MSTEKTKYQLSLLSSGDQNTKSFISFYEANDTVKDNVYYKLKENPDIVEEAIQSIFSETLSKELVIKITTVLVYLNAINASLSISDKDYYFALMVNFAIDTSSHKMKNKRKIMADTGVREAKNLITEHRKNKDSSDYREYLLVSVDDSDDSKVEYRNFDILEIPTYNTQVRFKLPTVNKLFGRAKFATTTPRDGKVTFSTDKDQTEYTLPYAIWMNLIKENILRSKKTWFNPDNTKGLISNKSVVEQMPIILSENNFEPAFRLPTMYDIEYSADQAKDIIISGDSKYMPNLEELNAPEGYEWRNFGGGRNRLMYSRGFYLVKESSSAYLVIHEK